MLCVSYCSSEHTPAGFAPQNSGGPQSNLSQGNFGLPRFEQKPLESLQHLVSGAKQLAPEDSVERYRQSDRQTTDARNTGGVSRDSGSEHFFPTPFQLSRVEGKLRVFHSKMT
jgi:hypothetical protein